MVTDKDAVMNDLPSSVRDRVIVHLMASPFFGGPERQVLGLAKQLGKGYRSVFISFPERGLAEPMLTHARNAGFEAIALQFNAPHFRRCIKEIGQHLKRLKADVVCCHGYKPDIVGLIAARLTKTPVVSVCRGWTSATWKVRCNEFVDRLSLHGMDHVICVSAAQAKKVLKVGVMRRHVSVAHNAVDTNRFPILNETKRSELRMWFPKKVQTIVAAAGRFSPEKGFRHFIDAAAIVLQDFSNVGFVLFGEGPLKDALFSQIRQRQIERSVKLAGFRSDLDQWIPNVDLVVIPSYTEGLSNIALEAHAAGIPIVATRVGGNPEVVKHNETGLLVPAGDAVEIAVAVKQLLSNPSERRRMGIAAQQRVRRHFTFDTQSMEYQRLFDQLCKRASADMCKC